jgi:hypothetical protein
VTPKQIQNALRAVARAQIAAGNLGGDKATLAALADAESLLAEVRMFAQAIADDTDTAPPVEDAIARLTGAIVGYPITPVQVWASDSNAERTYINKCKEEQL